MLDLPPSLPSTESPEQPLLPKKESEVRKTEHCTLETWTPFSQSHLWKLMMSFYDRQGVDSWSQGIVPHFITSNAFIGHAYAKVLLGFLQDCMFREDTMALDRDAPLYIVELGAGSGKFSHFMVNALVEMQKLSPFPLNSIKYIMTDFTEKNFQFWTTHPALQTFVKQGIIDFAIFNATTDTELHLHHSKVVLRAGSSVNPIVVVANYLFDTLYHDLFQLTNDGILKEGLISVGSKRSEEPDPLDPTIIKRLSNKYQYNPISTSYYHDFELDDDSLNYMLEWYQQFYTDPTGTGATVLVPIGALRAVRRLSALSSQRALILSGDKGHNNPSHFYGLSDPHIAVHGSFSVMVNYHAVGLYVAHRSAKGFAIHNPQEEASLKVACFVMDGANENNPNNLPPLGNEAELQSYFDSQAATYPLLQQAFQEYVIEFGPNDFFVLQKTLKEEATKATLKSVIALLKLSRWDPDVFYKFRDVILDQAPSCGQKLRQDMLRGIPLVWKNYYMLDSDKDIPFEIGRFYYGIRDYNEALNYYAISEAKIGAHHVTSHNIGLCHYSNGDLAKAYEYFENAVHLNNSYEKAKTWMERVKQELVQQSVPNTLESNEIEVEFIT